MAYTIKRQGKGWGIFAGERLVEGGFFDRDAALDALDDWQRDAAERRESIEDTPSIDNCDDAGTGEGRYHGRI
jgi:hypothetical protein